VIMHLAAESNADRLIDRPSEFTLVQIILTKIVDLYTDKCIKPGV
jgi:dTDP-D-glucose 4,6-dehydratase